VTIVTPSGLGPFSNIGIAPSLGGGAKQLLVDIGFAIGESIITNYITNRSSATKIQKTVARKIVRKTFRYAHKRYRTRYSSNTKYARKRYGSGRQRSRRWN